MEPLIRYREETLPIDYSFGHVQRFVTDGVAVIPAGVPHSLEAKPGQELEFVNFGTPPMSIDDERARPVKP